MSPASLANLRPESRPDAPNHRHGGYGSVAMERMQAKEREIFDALSADAPLRDTDGSLPSHDAVAVHLLAQCLCRLEDVAAHIRDYGMFDPKTKQPRPVLDVEAQLRREAAKHLDTLGMTPASRARLGVDVAKIKDLATELSSLPNGEVVNG